MSAAATAAESVLIKRASEEEEERDVSAAVERCSSISSELLDLKSLSSPALAPGSWHCLVSLSPGPGDSDRSKDNGRFFVSVNRKHARTQDAVV